MVFALFCGFTYAQKTVNGKVVNENNNPLPGADIIVKGTTNGTSTDFDGLFTIDASENDMLSVSMIGLLHFSFKYI